MPVEVLSLVSQTADTCISCGYMLNLSISEINRICLLKMFQGSVENESSTFLPNGVLSEQKTRCGNCCIF